MNVTCATVLLVFDLITYGVWGISYIWLLHDTSPLLDVYRNEHGKYVAHFFATLTLLRLARSRAGIKQDNVMSVLIFCFALVFDIFNVVYVLRYGNRVDNYVAWSLSLSISVVFMALSALMLLLTAVYSVCIEGLSYDKSRAVNRSGLRHTLNVWWG